MPSLIKVQSYDKVARRWIPAYINPSKIIMLTIIENEDDGDIYMCHLPDLCLRLSESSYYSVIHNLYGEEYKNGNNKG